MEGLLFALVLSGLCGLLQVLGFTLTPCGRDNTAEIVKGQTDNAFTCTSQGDGQRVDWIVMHNANTYTAATCSAGSTSGSCGAGGDLGAAFTASRLSGTETKVIVNPEELRSKEIVQSGTLRCGYQNSVDSCQMDYIVRTQGSCSIQPGTGSSRFQLDGKCSLTSAESSRGRFSCLWIRSGDGTSWERQVDLSASTYQSGCVLNEGLPTENGDYTYTVQLTPGRNSVAAGTVRIAKPLAPTLSGCGGEDYIPENTTVTCTCNTENVGQPAGRLQWVKVGDISVLLEGDYGVSSLAVSQRLLRSDHQPSLFRCNVQWTTDVIGSTVKFNVGYPPTEVFLGINQLQGDQTVNEHASVDFRCQNSNGRPNSTLSLENTNNNTVLASKKTYLRYVVVSRCEDSGQYQCTADNGMGPKFTGTPRSLFVRCSPRGPQDVGEVNFNNESVSTTFDVTAYPVPNQVTFQYLGPMGNETQSSVDDNEIQVRGSCEAKAGVVYQSWCTVTVDKVMDETAAGFYKVTVTNQRGSGDFRLQVLFRAPVTAAPGTGGGDDSFPTGIVVGVVVAVLVVSAIVVVVIFVIRRKKDPAKEKLQALGGPNSTNGSRLSGYHGQVDNPALEADPEEPAAATAASPPGGFHTSSDSGAAEGAYAVVNKPRKKKEEKEEEKGQPKVAASGGDVYAVVDMTQKKKNAGQGKKKAPSDKPKKGKGKKKAAGEEAEGHIYGNVDSELKENRGKRGQEASAIPMQETTGKQVNEDGLLYTSVDFTGISIASEKPPCKVDTADQSVLYSAVDFAKTGHI